MSSIKDQLLQMGLVSAAQAEGAGRRGERRGKRAERADDEAPATADEALIARIVEAGRVEAGSGGRRRFYYESRDDRVPYLELPDALASRLEKREAAICEAPDGTVSVVDADTARRIAALDRRWLRS